MNITSDIRGFLDSLGADLVSFADLRRIPSEAREGFDFGISIGVALDPLSLADVASGSTRDYYDEFNRVNRFLDSLALQAARFISERGYRARAHVATTGEFNPQTLATDLPHKTVATLSGLGWIGKCALFVTEQYGSALRLTKVLTDAPVDTGTPVVESRCGDCTDCKDACPGNASNGIVWEPGMTRDAIYNARVCRKTARKLALKRIGTEASFCGICIAVCPWTRAYIKRAV